MRDHNSPGQDVVVIRQDSSPRGANPLWKWGAGAAAGAALAGAALFNQRRAKRAERENPPTGKFVTVDGVALHYLERGEGEPIVLLHGNGAMAVDWEVSGLLDDLARTNRVIAFDRLGFGHSERPRTTIWSAAAQAKLIADALRLIGVQRPLVVGHSWGSSVTLALALDHREDISGIVLVGGYFFATPRADVVLMSPPAVPVVGDVMRYTVSPLLGSALMPAMSKKLFSPQPVPQRFSHFPMDMALRPSQIRAAAAEAALMVPSAVAQARRYEELDLPVTIVAGKSDKFVDPTQQSERLHEALPNSKLRLVEGSGHMVHYTATKEVAEAIRQTRT